LVFPFSQGQKKTSSAEASGGFYLTVATFSFGLLIGSPAAFQQRTQQGRCAGGGGHNIAAVLAVMEHLVLNWVVE